MQCDKAKSLLGWFFDGELDAATRALVAEHIEQCRDCAREVNAMHELDRISRQLVAPEPEAGLWDRIATRLTEQGAKSAATGKAVGRRRFLVAATALAASVAAGLLAYRTIRRHDSDTAKGGVSPTPKEASPPDPIMVNLASLGPEDRRLAESQVTCASAECDARLGAGGPPIKIVLQKEPVFVCCKQCEQWARAHPAQAVAKVHTLEHRDDEPDDR
jgi:hypothetical protein